MNTPRIFAIIAATIDGRIAYHAEHPTTWTSPEDKVSLRSLLDESGVIVVGRRTYDLAREPLSKRNCIVLTRSVPASEQQNGKMLLLNPAGASLPNALEKYPTVAVLGGTQTYTYCLENDLLDELYLTIEPVVFGKGLPIFSTDRETEVSFVLRDVERLNANGTILFHYKRQKTDG